MKNFFLSAGILLASLSVVSSCQKNLLSLSEEVDAKVCQLSVALGPLTKVVDQTESAEKTINDVQVFVFNKATGKLDASLRKDGLSGSGTVALTDPLSCTRGQREVWAVVNAPVNYVDGTDANRVTSLNQLKAITTSLTDNSPSNLIMVGSADKELALAKESIVVDVKRICAAVVLKSVKNEMSVPAYSVDGAVKITGAYLLNVPSEQNYALGIASSTLVQSKWISATSKTDVAAAKALTVDTYPAEIQTVNKGGTFSKISTFYAYPNSCPDLPVDVWKPSVTTLVVEATVAGQPCVYPIRLGELKSNYKYEVSLTLKHIGGDPSNPWKKVEFTDLGASITVVDWTSGTPVSETI